jgi:hypothetical protein
MRDDFKLSDCARRRIDACQLEAVASPLWLICGAQNCTTKTQPPDALNCGSPTLT